jgi:hypothetical protein
LSLYPARPDYEAASARDAPRCNMTLSQLLPLAGSAANLQQTLPLELQQSSNTQA